MHILSLSRSSYRQLPFDKLGVGVRGAAARQPQDGLSPWELPILTCRSPWLDQVLVGVQASHENYPECVCRQYSEGGFARLGNVEYSRVEYIASSFVWQGELRTSREYSADNCESTYGTSMPASQRVRCELTLRVPEAQTMLSRQASGQGFVNACY